MRSEFLPLLQFLESADNYTSNVYIIDLALTLSHVDSWLTREEREAFIRAYDKIMQHLSGKLKKMDYMMVKSIFLCRLLCALANACEKVDRALEREYKKRKEWSAHRKNETNHVGTAATTSSVSLATMYSSPRETVVRDSLNETLCPSTLRENCLGTTLADPSSHSSYSPLDSSSASPCCTDQLSHLDDETFQALWQLNTGFSCSAADAELLAELLEGHFKDPPPAPFEFDSPDPTLLNSTFSTELHESFWCSAPASLDTLLSLIIGETEALMSCENATDEKHIGDERIVQALPAHVAYHLSLDLLRSKQLSDMRVADILDDLRIHVPSLRQSYTKEWERFKHATAAVRHCFSKKTVGASIASEAPVSSALKESKSSPLLAASSSGKFEKSGEVLSPGGEPEGCSSSPHVEKVVTSVALEEYEQAEDTFFKGLKIAPGSSVEYRLRMWWAETIAAENHRRKVSSPTHNFGSIREDEELKLHDVALHTLLVQLQRAGAGAGGELLPPSTEGAAGSSYSLTKAIQDSFSKLCSNALGALSPLLLMQQQLRGEMALLTQRIIGTVVVYLVPAVYVSDPATTIVYKAWLCDLYARLYHLEMLPLQKFSKEMREQSISTQQSEDQREAGSPSSSTLPSSGSDPASPEEKRKRAMQRLPPPVAPRSPGEATTAGTAENDRRGNKATPLGSSRGALPSGGANKGKAEKEDHTFAQLSELLVPGSNFLTYFRSMRSPQGAAGTRASLLPVEEEAASLALRLLEGGGTGGDWISQEAGRGASNAARPPKAAHSALTKSGVSSSQSFRERVSAVLAPLQDIFRPLFAAPTGVLITRLVRGVIRGLNSHSLKMMSNTYMNGLAKPKDSEKEILVASSKSIKNSSSVSTHSTGKSLSATKNSWGRSVMPPPSGKGGADAESEENTVVEGTKPDAGDLKNASLGKVPLFRFSYASTAFSASQSFFSFPVVHTAGDVLCLYVDTMKQAELVLNPHDPVRSVLVLHAVEFMLLFKSDFTAEDVKWIFDCEDWVAAGENQEELDALIGSHPNTLALLASSELPKLSESCEVEGEKKGLSPVVQKATEWLEDYLLEVWEDEVVEPAYCTTDFNPSSRFTSRPSSPLTKEAGEAKGGESKFSVIDSRVGHSTNPSRCKRGVKSDGRDSQGLSPPVSPPRPTKGPAPQHTTASGSADGSPVYSSLQVPVLMTIPSWINRSDEERFLAVVQHLQKLLRTLRDST